MIDKRNLSVLFLLTAVGLGCATGGRATAARQARDVPLTPTTNPSAKQDVRKANNPSDLAVAAGGPAKGIRDPRLEAVYLFDGPPLPTGLTGTADGRTFVSFPRWTQPANYTAAEVTNGKLVPFPDAETNQFLPDQPSKFDPRTHLVSVQSVVVDGKGRLWLLDTGSINLQPPIKGGPKLWGYDLKTRQRVAAVDFSKGDAIRDKTYLNDVRFDLSRGEQGTAYITDSGAGGIIVVDLASGEAWRKLDNHPSTSADEEATLKVEGDVLKIRPPNSDETKPVAVASDGIALSPDGKTLYYTSMTRRDVFAVPTDALADKSADAGPQVRTVASKPSCNDGMVCDARGRLYTTDFESNALRVIDPATGGQPRVLVQDERLLWPDTLFVRDGYVYVSCNQLNRQGQFHRGQSLLARPFVVFRYPVSGAEMVKSR